MKNISIQEDNLGGSTLNSNRLLHNQSSNSFEQLQIDRNHQRLQQTELKNQLNSFHGNIKKKRTNKNHSVRDKYLNQTYARDRSKEIVQKYEMDKMIEHMRMNDTFQPNVMQCFNTTKININP